MKKIILIIACGGFLISAGYYLNSLITKQTGSEQGAAREISPNQFVGADSDEHGCKISAGYSWCELKNKCLRPWEEKCEETTEDPGPYIRQILADKYNKSLEEVNITINKSDTGFAGGSVKFSSEGPGGLFLARKTNGNWEVVFDGNGSVDCIQLKQTYGFPDSVLKPNFCD